jgi:hypothetical protein
MAAPWMEMLEVPAIWLLKIFSARLIHLWFGLGFRAASTIFSEPLTSLAT